MSVATGVSRDSFAFVCGFVHRRAAIVLEPGKEYLVEARLAPIAKAKGLDSLDALVERLRRDENGLLAKEVVEAMTTNETSFFRDVHPFDTLRTVVLPELVAARANSRTLRIWCAASSTGQEPYSIAMLIREHFPQLATWNVQIVGTDINDVVLERARRGIFTQLEVNRGLPAMMLVKHFEKKGTDWVIKEHIRKMVSFDHLNLLGSWPFSLPQDVVFMRNVLIYFDMPTRRTIVPRVRSLLSPDGYFFLGGAETTTNIDPLFEAQRIGASASVYRPLQAQARAPGHSKNSMMSAVSRTE